MIKLFDSFDGAITICDKNALIQYMNKKAIETFAAEGGEKLIGTNLLDCHGEESRKKLEFMMANRVKNVYTIEKKGQEETDLSSSCN